MSEFVIPKTRPEVEATIQKLKNPNLVDGQHRRDAYLKILYDALATCLCRKCSEKYDNRKARADFKGFCSAKCQHAAAKDAGYKLKGHRSEYACLKAADNIGDVPVIPTE